MALPAQGMTRRAALGMLVGTAVAACGRTSGAGSAPMIPSTVLPVGSVPVPSASPGADGAPGGAGAAAAASAVGAFGFALERAVAAADPGKNTTVSPWSVALAFGMAEAGARGTTATELQAALHTAGLGAGRHDAIAALQASLAVPATDDVRLDVANAGWPAYDVELLRSFTDVLARDYRTKFTPLDFGRPGAVATINDWVATATNGKITQLFAKLDPATKLVLTNAVYFKARWAWPFPGFTQTAPFVRRDGTTVEVAFLSDVPHGYTVGVGAGWKAAEKRYAGDRFAMTFVLPDEGTFDTFTLTPALWQEVDGALGPQVSELWMPKFTIDSQPDLKQVMQALGVRSAFAPGADFSGISSGAPLWIDQAVHRAKIDVDEWGTEAAAATGIAFTTSGPPTLPPVVVHLDHPFFYAVRDRQTGTILFIGRVLDPTQAS